MPYGGRHYQAKPGSKRGGGYLCAYCSRPTEKAGCHNQACKPVYFASKVEKARAAELLFLRDQGKIDSLEWHPRAEMKLNGQAWRTYVADSRYRDVETGRITWEDVKPKGWREFDESAKMKIDAFRLLFPSETLLVVER